MGSITPQKPTNWSEANKHLMYTGVPISPHHITSAAGTKLFTSTGRQILDFTSGQMSSLLGHSHPEIVSTLVSSAQTLDHLLSNMITQPVVDLAAHLSSLLPPALSKSFFLSTGSESIEAAIKIAKHFTGKFEVVAFSASYHGLTQGAGAATFSAGRKNGGPCMPGQLVFPAPDGFRSPFRRTDGSYDWEGEMEWGWGMVDRTSVGSLAAFVVEPILSTGGILVPPEGYFRRLQAECRKRGMLVVVDEAQTGVGRTGRMFGFEWEEGFVPDVLCLSKTLGCGLPLASVTTSEEIEKKVREAGFLWLTTHLNDPLPAAVGKKVLEIVEREDVCRMARERGMQLREGLERLKEKYRCIGDVRGRGLMQGIEIVAEPRGGDAASAAALGQIVSDRAMDLGLSCNIVNLPGMGGVFRIAPPVTVTAEEIDEGLDILDRAFAWALDQD